jgi:hypothetical protein
VSLCHCLGYQFPIQIGEGKLLVKLLVIGFLIDIERAIRNHQVIFPSIQADLGDQPIHDEVFVVA